VKKALLIDGHSVIFRSFYAFIRQPLRNSRGRNTSAVFGFASTLRKLLSTFKPDLCVVVFDAPGPTFRHEKFEQYKIQRPEVPEELPDQIPVIKELARAWGLAVLEQPGVEADDVLGTLARRFSAEDCEVTIATSDKDILQLVNERVTVFDPWKEKRYRAQDVKEKLGVGPEQVIDYLALAGDASDNIPGVPGIGPKRALTIIGRYGTLEQALKHEPKLAGHEAIARLSHELVTIRTDVKVADLPDEFKPAEPDKEALRRIYEEMDFTSLLRELGPEQAGAGQVTEVQSDAGLPSRGRLCAKLLEGQGVWFTTDGAGVSFVPWKRRKLISDLLGQEGLTLAGIGAKDQLKAARSGGTPWLAGWFDVGIAAWLCDPNRRGYELEDITSQLLGRPVVAAGPEAEPALVLQLLGAVEPQMAALGLERVFRELEMPLVPILARMEEAGIKVDVQALSALGKELGAKQAEVRKSIWQAAGTEFNIDSPKQLGQVLFEKLGLPKGRKTKTGFSTSLDVLEELAAAQPIVRDVLAYRELAKLGGTYVEPLLAAVDPDTGRVHAEFNQTGTATGRLSSSNPNLQNVPIRSELGRTMRKVFVAEDGYRLLSADYSQIELRVLAHVSGDEELKAAFSRGEDIHVATASAVFEVPADKVTPEQRRLAKVVNYGLIYGMGDYGMSWRMGIPKEQARGFLDSYMSRFAQAAAWRDRLIEQAKQDGFVRTISGRMRPVPGITSDNRAVAEASKRAALNAPVQGSAADIIKRAMIGVTEELERTRLDCRLILQIHDELLFEVREDEVVRAREIVRQAMEGAWNLSVPLVVETGVGKNWSEAH